MNPSFWSGKTIFITGHTGFKGSWLSLWLNQMGAKVYGYSLDPPTDPALFDVAKVGSLINGDIRGDIAELNTLKTSLKGAKPDIIFHFAAQSLVRFSYANPLMTFATNIMGTANLLEAAREIDNVGAIIVATTDKVYQNDEDVLEFNEKAPLGGHDPYSASKAAAEIITASYRSSLYNRKDYQPLKVATARAGNVIGGGDWAVDRLIPDCLRSFTSGEPVRLRYPEAIRPWQHVLEPLSGYLTLAENLFLENGASFSKAWNFGPKGSNAATVKYVADSMAKHWGNGATVASENNGSASHEATILRLDSSLAYKELGWLPRWSLKQTLEKTVEWHQQWLYGTSMSSVCRDQIEVYMSDLRAPLKIPD